MNFLFFLLVCFLYSLANIAVGLIFVFIIAIFFYHPNKRHCEKLIKERENINVSNDKERN